MFSRLQKQSGLVVNFTQNIVDEHFLPETNITAFRIVQEALTNVIRYSGATEAAVTVWVQSNLLSIIIEDKGRGFTLSALSQGTSTGLSAMRERAKMLEGTFKVDSAPGMGTRITVQIPVQHDTQVDNANSSGVPSVN
jgi:signal transduction histidine kinase